MATTVLTAGDRIRRTDTGELATFVGYHGDGGAGKGPLQVLRDTGPMQATTWGTGVPLERHSGRPLFCPRCDLSGHNAINCREGDRP